MEIKIVSYFMNPLQFQIKSEPRPEYFMQLRSEVKKKTGGNDKSFYEIN